MTQKFHAKSVFSVSIQGGQDPILKELVDQVDCDSMIDFMMDLPVGATNTIDFGDMKIAPKVLIIMSDITIRLDFGIVGAPFNIRNIYAVSYTDIAPPDYVHIIGTLLTTLAKVRVIAYGNKIP